MADTKAIVVEQEIVAVKKNRPAKKIIKEESVAEEPHIEYAIYQDAPVSYPAPEPLMPYLAPPTVTPHSGAYKVVKRWKKDGVIRSEIIGMGELKECQAIANRFKIKNSLDKRYTVTVEAQ